MNKRLDIKGIIIGILILLFIYEVLSLGIFLKYNKTLKKISLLEETITNLGNTNDELDYKINKIKSDISNNESIIAGKKGIIDKLESKKQTKEEPNNKYDNIPTFYQYNGFPTGCESVALYLLLRYYDVDVTVDDIVDRLPQGYDIYIDNDKKYGPNPNKQFVGNPRESGNSLGVWNDPIQKVANIFQKGAISKEDFSFDELLKIIDSGRPAVVWTSLNLSEPFRYLLHYDEDTGEEVYFIRGEHAVLLIDYTSKYVVISDPHTGTIRYQDKEKFERIYNYMGKRAVYY